MFFRFFKQRHSEQPSPQYNSNYEQQIERGIEKLEKLERVMNKLQQLERLESQLQRLEKRLDSLSTEKQSITIERLFVEKVLIDQVDLSNNFGQFGVKELSGELNIGTSYDLQGEEMNAFVKKQLEYKMKQATQNERSPTVHFHKREDEK